MTSRRDRFTDIDYAKGLAIILVVIGHVVATEYPIDNEWFMFVKSTIYRFHMPFFMFLFCFIFFHTKPTLENIENVLTFVKSRAMRLLVPFVLFACIVIFGKYFAAFFLHVDNPVTNITEAFINAFWNTSESKVSFIWYIYVLFIFNLVTIGLLKIFNNKLFPLLLIGYIIYFIDVPQIMYLDLICKVYFFFVLGGVLLQGKNVYYAVITQTYSRFTLFIFFFLILFFVLYFFNFLVTLLLSLLSIPALHYVMCLKTVQEKCKVFLIAGKYTMSIYLLNVIVIGVVKAVMLKIIPWDGLYFLIYLPILTFTGLVVPIGIRKYLFTKIPVMDKITA